MTGGARAKERKKGIGGAIFGLLSLGLVFVYVIVFSEKVGNGILEGLSLALTRVIPTALPFMIISDLYLAYGRAEEIAPMGTVFGKCFGVPAVALRSYITGLVAGFPIGVKAVSDLYRMGGLTRADAERLCAYCSSPSAAFVIGAVGGGLFKDIKIGIILFLSIFASSVVLGLLTRKNCEKSPISCDITGQSFNIIESINNAASSCITVAAFISLFSALGEILRFYIKKGAVKITLTALLEVTSAVEFFGTLYTETPLLSFALCGFSLGFGGLSVMLQSAYFLRREGLSLKKYIPYKLIQGVLCAAISSLAFTFLY